MTGEEGEALFRAAERGWVEEVRSLLTCGVDPGWGWGREVGSGAGPSCWVEGDTPLHAAARSGHAEVVSLLLCAGAPVNARNVIGEAPLHYACMGCRLGGLAEGCEALPGLEGLRLGGNRELVAIALLEGGADPHLVCDAAISPLDLALMVRGHFLFRLLGLE